MERPQTLPNLLLIIQTLGWLLALEGVAEFFSSRHTHTSLRKLVLLFVDRDPAQPQLPDSWDEWYHS